MTYNCDNSISTVTSVMTIHSGARLVRGAGPRAAHRADPWARNDRGCRIDRFIRGGSVINAQRLCHLGVTIEAHKGKAGGERAGPYRIFRPLSLLPP